jgi:RNA polymerase sigma-70 factor, ECF subfamily
MTELDLRALRRGDEFAFRELVSGYHSTLFRLAMIYSPSRSAAEEAVRETWRVVLGGLDGFAGRASMRTWVCRTLMNIARHRAGRDTRTASFAASFAGPFAALDDGFAAVPPDRFLDSGPFVGHWKDERDDRMRSQELCDVVGAAIAELPASQREVITLRDIEGWNTVEVSDLLGIEEGNQRMLLHRARSRVRQALEDYLAPSVSMA